MDSEREDFQARAIRAMFPGLDYNTTRLVVVNLLLALDQQLQYVQRLEHRWAYLHRRLVEFTGITDQEASDYIEQYRDTIPEAYRKGRYTSLPQPDKATRRRDFPRYLTEEESRISEFVEEYMFHRISKPQWPLFSVAEQALGNTEKETLELIRWMDANLDQTLGYYEWAQLDPQNPLLIEFKDQQAKGGLRNIDDNGW